MSRMCAFIVALTLALVMGVSHASAATLAGHWNLNEMSGGTAIDSISGNNGTWQNGTSTNLARVPGIIGRSADLSDAGGNGANNFFTIPSINQFVGADGLSISAWVDPDGQANSGYNGIFMTRDFNGASNNSWGIAIENSGGEHLDSRLDGPGIDSPPNSLSPANGWHHLVLTYDANTKTHRQYINGLQTNMADVSGDGNLGATLNAPSGPWFIGYDNCCGNSRDFDGRIDDVSVWQGALSAGEVQQIYRAGYFNVSAASALAFSAPTSAVPVTNGLQLWLDAADLTTITAQNGQLVSEWRDKSGLNNHASQATAGKQPSLTSNGINGLPTLRFNDDQLTIPGGLSIGNGDPRTIFLVVDYSVNDGNSEVFGTTTGTMIDLGSFFQTERVRLRDNVNGGPGDDGFNGIYSGDGSAPFGSHIITVEAILGGGTNVLLDGSLILSDPGSFSHFDLATALGIGGANFNGREYNGDLSEVLVFDRLLSDAERNDVGFYLASKYGLQTEFVGAVPEPASAWLLAAGVTVLVTRRRRTTRQG